MEKIFIIGTGWLGSTLGEFLTEKGFDVRGCYRTQIRSSMFKQVKLENLKSELNEFNPDIVVVTIPPGKKEEESLRTIDLFCQTNVDPRLVIYTSSTGIYPSTPGKYDESSMVRTNSPLHKTELKLRKRFDNFIALRLGGLYGPGRHPLKYLSGKLLEANGNDPIRLIHRDDVISILSRLIETKKNPEILNFFFPSNYSKLDFYELLANKMGIASPLWKQIEGEQRIISTIDDTLLTDFSFEHDPLLFTFDFQDIK